MARVRVWLGPHPHRSASAQNRRSKVYILIIVRFPASGMFRLIFMQANFHGRIAQNHNMLSFQLTAYARCCIYESCRASRTTTFVANATGASSNPIATSAGGLVSASYAISAPLRSCSNAFPRLREARSTPKRAILVQLPRSGTLLNSWALSV